MRNFFLMMFVAVTLFSCAEAQTEAVEETVADSTVVVEEVVDTTPVVAVVDSVVAQ